MVVQVLQRIKSYRFSLGFFIIFITLYLGVITVFGINRPAWGDEEHFVQTIQQFGQGMTLDLLRTYSEMSTPFPFMMYAIWGKLFGFELATLRILSLVIAFCTAMLFWWLCYKIFHDAFSASVCSIFLFINPYIAGFSLFVFPDMVTISWLIAALLAFLDKKSVLFGIACALGLLSRQYFVFFPLAVFIHAFYMLLRKDRNYLPAMLAAVFSTIPTLLLFWLWGGFSPQNSLRQLYMGYAFKFYPPALTLYIILLGAYLAPLVIYRWRKYYKNLFVLFLASIISGVYIFFPVRASVPSLNNGIDTVGYLHRFLVMLAGRYANWILYAFFLLSLPVLIHIINAWLHNDMQTDFRRLSGLAILLFLIIMPFSYLWWEKYFVLVLPLVIIEVYNPIADVGQ